MGPVVGRRRQRKVAFSDVLLAQHGRNAGIQSIERVPGPGDLKILVEIEDHVPHHVHFSGTLYIVQQFLHRTDRQGVSVRQAQSLVRKANDVVLSHFGQLGVERMLVGLPHHVAGQIDLAQSVFITFKQKHGASFYRPHQVSVLRILRIFRIPVVPENVAPQIEGRGRIERKGIVQRLERHQHDIVRCAGLAVRRGRDAVFWQSIGDRASGESQRRTGDGLRAIHGLLLQRVFRFGHHTRHIEIQAQPRLAGLPGSRLERGCPP